MRGFHKIWYFPIRISVLKEKKTLSPSIPIQSEKELTEPQSRNFEGIINWPLVAEHKITIKYVDSREFPFGSNLSDSNF